MSTSSLNTCFTTPLLNWFDVHGRHDLPWQTPREAYRVWISEIMLQQTQVKTVIPYFNRFIARFPTLSTLANAHEDAVLSLWSGLGYYSRARNLQKTARRLMDDFFGEFPSDIHALESLPGIGPSTAAAIASLAFDRPTAILDGNVKRVLSRYFLIAGPLEKAAAKQILWQYANECMSTQRSADYTQAIMDLGATRCTPKKPLCAACPLNATCAAYQYHLVEQYPQKPNKKILPIKQEQFLLLSRHDASIYLEKRPSSGVWGGLWCLPTLNMEQCPKTYLQETHQLTAKTIEPLLRIKHTFSHFHLIIHALVIRVNEPQHTTNDGNWFDATALTSLGLATPVNAIIQHFFSTVSGDEPPVYYESA